MPPSGIGHCDYPDMFPSPPVELEAPSSHGGLGVGDGDVVPDNEKGWFYYLAEISCRRMMNRVYAVMGCGGEHGWVKDIEVMFTHYETFKEQINVWYVTLGPWSLDQSGFRFLFLTSFCWKHNYQNSTSSPHKANSGDRCSHIPPQLQVLPNDEIAQYVQNRAITCREWIHRPFLYYVIHQPPEAPRYMEAMALAQQCLQLCIDHLLRAPGFPQHQSTWYFARGCATCALILLAAAESGKSPSRLGGRTLWG